MTEREVAFETRDGRRIAAALSAPERDDPAPAALLVHGSQHERDAFGPGLTRSLSERGVAAMRVDTRGRGASRDPVAFHEMGPVQRRAVRHDVGAAVAFLAREPGIDGRRIAVVAEQDAAGPAALAATADRRVRALALVSGRLGRTAKGALARSAVPLFCIVSKEDRRGFVDMLDVYLASRSRRSRLAVLEGVGFGTTMFSAWQFTHQGEPPIEETIAGWLAGVLGYPSQRRPRRART